MWALPPTLVVNHSCFFFFQHVSLFNSTPKGSSTSQWHPTLLKKNHSSSSPTPQECTCIHVTRGNRNKIQTDALNVQQPALTLALRTTTRIGQPLNLLSRPSPICQLYKTVPKKKRREQSYRTCGLVFS